jgi:threonine synthase
MAGLFERDERFTVVPNDLTTLKTFVKERLS